MQVSLLKCHHRISANIQHEIKCVYNINGRQLVSADSSCQYASCLHLQCANWMQLLRYDQTPMLVAKDSSANVSGGPPLAQRHLITRPWTFPLLVAVRRTRSKGCPSLPEAMLATENSSFGLVQKQSIQQTNNKITTTKWFRSNWQQQDIIHSCFWLQAGRLWQPWHGYQGISRLLCLPCGVNVCMLNEPQEFRTSVSASPNYTCKGDHPAEILQHPRSQWLDQSTTESARPCVNRIFRNRNAMRTTTGDHNLTVHGITTYATAPRPVALKAAKAVCSEESNGSVRASTYGRSTRRWLQGGQQ